MRSWIIALLCAAAALVIAIVLWAPGPLNRVSPATKAGTPEAVSPAWLCRDNLKAALALCAEMDDHGARCWVWIPPNKLGEIDSRSRSCVVVVREGRR